MTEKKSIKATISGLGASLLSLAGICCGTGACAAACGPVLIAPVASFLGLSSAGISSLMSGLLPLFAAASAVAFTVAYYSIYKKPATECCDDPAGKSVARNRNPWVKPAFWVGLLLTTGLYANAMVQDLLPKDSGQTCQAAAANGSEVGKPACKPSSCKSTKNE